MIHGLLLQHMKLSFLFAACLVGDFGWYVLTLGRVFFLHRDSWWHSSFSFRCLRIHIVNMLALAPGKRKQVMSGYKWSETNAEPMFCILKSQLRTSADPEQKNKKLSAELANGRLAMTRVLAGFGTYKLRIMLKVLRCLNFSSRTEPCLFVLLPEGFTTSPA